MQQIPPPMQQHQIPPPYPQQQQMWAQQPPAPMWGQPPPAPMWGQQPSQIPPPVPVQTQQAQYPVQSVQAQPSSADEVKTLWIGDLQPWMDDTYVYGCFPQPGEVISVKLIRNKQTGQPGGYGFIEFATRAIAERVLQTYNGTMMPNIEQAFRLNWASFGAGERRDSGPDHTIFVGDLAPDVTDYVLQETFRVNYPSVKGAKVVTDKLTGRSKGYGFVRFGDANEQTRAMTEMNGQYCSTRAMRIGPAASKKAGDDQQYQAKAAYQTIQGTQSEEDPNNTTIFVGGLDTNVSEDQLRQTFITYGELVHVKIPMGKRCGFVQFAKRACAEEALLMLQGTQMGGQSVRLSWGRSPSSRQSQQQPQDPNQWNNNYYGYGQGYEAYGYAQPPQDPNMYAYEAAYPNYANYQQQQQ